MFFLYRHTNTNILSWHHSVIRLPMLSLNSHLARPISSSLMFLRNQQSGYFCETKSFSPPSQWKTFNLALACNFTLKAQFSLCASFFVNSVMWDNLWLILNQMFWLCARRVIQLSAVLGKMLLYLSASEIQLNGHYLKWCCIFNTSVFQAWPVHTSI